MIASDLDEIIFPEVEFAFVVVNEEECVFGVFGGEGISSIRFKIGFLECIFDLFFVKRLSLSWDVYDFFACIFGDNFILSDPKIRNWIIIAE